jgi:hypothetical protein
MNGWARNASLNLLKRKAQMKAIFFSVLIACLVQHQHILAVVASVTIFPVIA